MKYSIVLLLGLAFAMTSCGTYSSVSEVQPNYRSQTPAGQIISRSLNHPSKDALVQIGAYLDATAAAAMALKKNPLNSVALADYNFAVSRIIETTQQAGLEPWKAPLHCPGVNGEWVYSFNADNHPGLNPSNFVQRPADRYVFKGELVTQRTLKEGLGAPMVATSKGIDLTKIDPFAMGKNIYYGLTAVIDFQGHRCVARALDPLAVETVSFENNSYPLAADFTAPIALALAELNPRKIEIARLFKPEEFMNSTRLARLQPYDPTKIPVLVIHGLGDSQATWAPMIETLRGDPIFRKNYQIWFYSYPTGYPFPLMAAELRDHLDAINARYPDHKRIVVLGHSMGGMIARTLITDSGMTIWNAYFENSPEKTPLSKETRKIVAHSLIFKHRPEISRVVFLSASLGGSEIARNFLGRLGVSLIGTPADLSNTADEFVKFAKPDNNGAKVERTPNSVAGLDPNSRFLIAINKIPPAKSIPYHSIIADRGKGGNPDHTPPMSSDGLVPYWSSHIDGAQSELIVPSDHWSNRNPQGIAEVDRILHEHLKHQ